MYFLKFLTFKLEKSQKKNIQVRKKQIIFIYRRNKKNIIR